MRRAEAANTSLSPERLHWWKRVTKTQRAKHAQTEMVEGDESSQLGLGRFGEGNKFLQRTLNTCPKRREFVGENSTGDLK